MSEKSTKVFIEKMKTDEAFRTKILAVEDVDERMKLIKAEGFECSEEEIKLQQDKLDDEALDTVAGGWGRFCTHIWGDTFGCC